MKEGDKGTRRQVKPKKKKREPKTKLQNKCGSKKEKGRPEEENFVKKQVSHSIQRAYPSSQ
jgi:hypothetical protein